MKAAKIIIGAILSLVITIGYAQQSEYSQYYVNLPATNPGFTGIDGFMDLKAGFRQGWNDFEDQNTSAFISAYGSLNKPLKQMVKSNSLRISDPTVFKRIEKNKKLRRKHGAGGILSNKNLGPYQLTQAFINYAYHLPVSSKLNWAMGTKIGYRFQKVDFTNYTVRDQNDAFYQQLINSGEGRKSSLLIDFGTVLYAESFYFGVSTNSIISTDISSDNILQEEVLGQYQFQIGKNISLANNVDISLGGAGNYSEGFDPGWMLNTRIKFKNLVYIGAGYEYEKRLSMLFGVVADGKYAVHYSYDKYLSELTNFNVNSHEVIVGIFIFNKFKLSSKFW